jgi:hypothetical protein
MQVTVMAMVIPMLVPVRFGIRPVGHVKKQEDYTVPENGDGCEVDRTVDEQENHHDRERRDRMEKGKDARADQAKPGPPLSLKGVENSYRPAVAWFHSVQQTN